MNRLESLTAWFCTTLGVTLMAVSVLVAPDKLFADSSSDCGAACCQSCFGTSTCNGGLDSCWTNCTGDCMFCQSMCNGNPTCLAMCLSTARSGQCPDDPVLVCKEAGKVCYNANVAGTCKPTKAGNACTCVSP